MCMTDCNTCLRINLNNNNHCICEFVCTYVCAHTILCILCLLSTTGSLVGTQVVILILFIWYCLLSI